MTNENLLALIGSVELKLYYAQYIECDPNVWHREDFVPSYEQIYFITKGACIITIDGIEYFPKEGQLIYMPAGHKMSYRMAGGYELAKYWCHFNAAVGGRELLSFFKSDYLVTLSPKECKVLSQLFKQMKPFPSPNQQSIEGHLKANAFLNQVISFYLSVSKAQLREETYGAEHGFPTVIDYITNHLNRQITAPELAALVGLHPNYFINRFHSLYGYSPLQYIKKVRIDKAKQLLCGTDMTVGEVALAVGFGDPLYFSGAFKASCGFSPTDYRKLFL